MSFEQRLAVLVLLTFSTTAVAEFRFISEIPESNPDVQYGFGNPVEADNGDVLMFNARRTECCEWTIIMDRTRDGGESWEQSVVLEGPVEEFGGEVPVAIKLPNGDLLLTADVESNNGYKVWLSRDHGESWAALSDKPFLTRDWSLSPEGLLVSLDVTEDFNNYQTSIYDPASDSWTTGPIATGTDLCSYSIHASSESQWEIYYDECNFAYGTTGTVFRIVTTDGGASWSDPEGMFTAGGGLGSQQTKVITIDGILYAVFTSGYDVAYRISNDGGNTWSEETAWTAGNTILSGDIKPDCRPSSLGPLCAFEGRRSSNTYLMQVGIAGKSRDPLLGPIPIGPGHSGSWYNSAEDGHGFSLEFGTLSDNTPFAVAYWYVYDSVGNPIFFVGSGVPEGNVVELDLVSPVGMEFGVFDPASVQREPAGTARFVFSDDATGTFSYEPSAFSINEWGHTAVMDLPVTKLFGIPTADESFGSNE